jgi:GNAT superfamily N-acetyltransferase
VKLVDMTAEDPRLDSYYRGIYWDEFADQHEPFAAWQRALRGEDAYRLHVRLALDGEAIVGGISYELYPRSMCGLITYMAVAPSARRHGVGKQLQSEAVAALFAAGAHAVLGEVNDPRTTTLEPSEVAWRRLARTQRGGARVVDVRYVQPALGPGLARDRELLLIALAGDRPLPTEMSGSIVRAFVDELYAVTEAGPPDPEIAIADRVPLVELVLATMRPEKRS